MVKKENVEEKISNVEKEIKNKSETLKIAEDSLNKSMKVFDINPHMKKDLLEIVQMTSVRSH